jgi:enamine deaminase RidA (YjgF/YER057c/UK114 family)
MIQRWGESARWADVVIHRGTAYWVEVAENPEADAAHQIQQVLQQIDATLATIGSDRTKLLMVTIHLADLADASHLNALWDAWVLQGHLPVRACVQSGLSGPYRVEMAIVAAVADDSSTT